MEAHPSRFSCLPAGGSEQGFSGAAEEEVDEACHVMQSLMLLCCGPIVSSVVGFMRCDVCSVDTLEHCNRP